MKSYGIRLKGLCLEVLEISIVKMCLSITQFEGLMQEKHNSIANALELCLSSIANTLELHLSCINPSNLEFQPHLLGSTSQFVFTMRVEFKASIFCMFIYSWLEIKNLSNITVTPRQVTDSTWQKRNISGLSTCFYFPMWIFATFNTMAFMRATLHQKTCFWKGCNIV